MTLWTAATRTISGAVMTEPFSYNHVGRGIGFVIGLVAYWGRVAKVVSSSSVILHPGSSLPAANGSISQAILFDLGERHKYQDYLDDIDAKVQDDQEKVTLIDVQKMLRSAVTNYGKDRPIYVKVAVTGDGTDSYLLSTALGAFWVYGFTHIRAIEYPVGEKPACMLERDDFDDAMDDGTAQDGSNIKLALNGISPSASESFIVEVPLQFSLPEIGLQNFPDTDQNFENICTLASAYCCFALAAAYAPSKDAQISADVVNYNDKSRKYTDLARQYMKRYFLNVFGQEDPPSGVSAAFVDIELDADDSQGGDYLFHRRQHR